MTDSTPKSQNQINRSIIGAIGEGNHITQNILPQPGQPAPYMLPPDIADFTGRADDITEVEGLLTQGKIAAIDGMGGVGKSALAIHVAHRLKARFLDAQLYLNLYGQTPESALTPKKALIMLLQALTGGDESQLATDLDGLVAQYRSTLAGKRALVILDNAKDEEQVRSLLPNSRDCAVLITSRSRLTGLSGATLVDLEPMVVDDAELLFQAIVHDSNRSAAEPATVREIVKLCGRLPMAIRIAAATLNQQIWKGKPLTAYAQALATEETRLSKLENPQVEAAIPGQGGIRASFNLSYQALATEEQQLFRWAGGLPGVDFGLTVVAWVIKQEESQTETGLGQLLEAHVLQLSEDRFSFHDLMRLFAREQLTEPERETALDRGLAWYCQNAAFWNQGLDPVRCRQLAQEWAAETESSAEELEQSLPMLSLNWFTAEGKNWVELVQTLTQLPCPDDAIALAANLAPFFSFRGIWDDWVTTHELVKDCAQQANNLPGIAATLSNLGVVYANQGKWDGAIDSYQQSLEIKRQLGNPHGIAQSLNNLGSVYYRQGKWDEAIDSYQQSLDIQRQLGNPQGIAQSLMGLGVVYANQGKWDGAIDSYQQSLDIERQLGNPHGIAGAINNLGNVYDKQGKWDEAIDSYQQSLDIQRQLGNPQGIAQSLNNLGIVYANQGKLDGAIDYYQQSLDIERQLGNPHGIAKSLGNLGNVYGSQGKWDEAIDSHQQSLAILRQLRDSHGIAQAINNLGNVYDSQGKWDEAIDSYRQSLAILRQLRDSHGIAQSLNNLGNVYHKQGKWDKAIDFHQQSLDINRQLGNPHGIAATLNNLGTVYATQGKWDEAINFCQQSLDIERQLGNTHGIGSSLANLGIIHYRCDQLEQAQTIWQEALTYLHPSSPEFQQVQQWLATPAPSTPKRAWVNYLLPLGIGVFLLVCLVKGYWLLMAVSIAILGFLFRRSWR